MAELVAAEIARIPEVRVCSRSQIRLLPGEQMETGSESGRKTLGRIVGADILLLVDAGRNAFGFIDAQTGTELFRIREDTPEQLVRSAAALIQEQRDGRTVRATIVIVLENSRVDRVKQDYFLTDVSTQLIKPLGPPAR